MQSPINIESPDLIHLNRDLTLKFGNISNDVKADIENTGKTLKSSFRWMDMELSLEGIKQQLQTTQLHFKAPSEHTLNGNHYSLEMQIVSKNLNQKGTYVILSLLMETNRKVGKNELTDPFSAIAYNLKAKGMTGSIEINFADALTRELGKLSELEFFTYLGSLTTPPCVENIRWIIVTQPLQISFEEMNSFTELWKGNEDFAGGNGNNRRQQDLYGREILRGEILELEKKYINELIASETQKEEEKQNQQQGGLNYYSQGEPVQNSVEGQKSKLYYMSTYDSAYLKNFNNNYNNNGINMVKKGKHFHKLQKYKKIIPKIEPQQEAAFTTNQVNEIFGKQTKHLVNKKKNEKQQQQIHKKPIAKEKPIKKQKKELKISLKPVIQKNKNSNKQQQFSRSKEKNKEMKVKIAEEKKKLEKEMEELQTKEFSEAKQEKKLESQLGETINQETDNIKAIDQTNLDKQIFQLTKKIDTLKKESKVPNEEDINQEIPNIIEEKTENLYENNNDDQIKQINEDQENTKIVDKLQNIKSKLEDEKQFLEKEKEYQQNPDSENQEKGKSWSLWKMVVNSFGGSTD